MPAIKQLVRWTSAVVVALISALWLIVSFRYVAVPAYLAMVLLLFAAAYGIGLRGAVVAVGVFVLATLSPVDIRLPSFEGSPRLVPYVMGLPTSATVEKAARGEVVLGGCIVSGFEPQWVLVW